MRTPASRFVVCILLITPSASADFVGVKSVNKHDPETDFQCTQGNGAFVPGPLTVCNVFANFDNPVDRLLSVGNGDMQVFNGANPGVFFQHGFNAAVIAPTCFFVQFIAPDLICDTFVTIGYECGPAPAGTDATTPDGDFDLYEFNYNGNVVGGWYDASPPNGGEDCSCLPVLEHLFLQASVAEGRTVFGTVDLRWKAGSTDEITVEQGVFVECNFGCDADLDGDGAVGASDLAQLLGSWGPCDDCEDCPADFNDDCAVNAFDLAQMLATWGPCP